MIAVYLLGRVLFELLLPAHQGSDERVEPAVEVGDLLSDMRGDGRVVTL
jgi:hypothetical protein